MTKKIILTVLALIIVALPILTYQWIHRGERQIFANEGYKIGAMTLDEQGRVWACYENDDSQYVGVFQIDKLITSNKVSGDDIGICNAIVAGRQENIWVNYPVVGELRMFDGESWTTVTNTESDSILAIDRLGNIWIGTDSRLDVFDGKSWGLFQLNNLSSTNSDISINAIAFDDNDHAWVGAFGGLYTFDGKEWQISDRYELTSVNAIKFDKKGKAWIGSSNGLATFDGNNWVDINSVDTVVSDVFFDNEGRVWTSRLSELSVFDNGEWKYYLGEYVYPDTPYSRLVDHEGQIWFVSTIGFMVLSPEELNLASSSTPKTLILLTVGSGVWLVVAMMICIWMAYALNSWKGVGLGSSLGALISIFSLLQASSENDVSWLLDNAQFFLTSNFSIVGLTLMVGGAIGGLIFKFRSQQGKPNPEVKGAILGWVITIVALLILYLIFRFLSALIG